MHTPTINLSKEEVIALPLDGYLSRYVRQENINAHSENVVLQAKRYGNDEQIKEAITLLDEHLKTGYLTDDLHARRKLLNAELAPFYKDLYA